MPYEPPVLTKVAMDNIEETRRLEDTWQHVFKYQSVCPSCGAPWREYGWDHKPADEERIRDDWDHTPADEERIRDGWDHTPADEERIRATCENGHVYTITITSSGSFDIAAATPSGDVTPPGGVDVVSEGILRKNRWQKAKMEWYVLGKNVICAKCHGRLPDKVKSRAIKLEKVHNDIVCAKCGAAPLSVRKGAVALLETGGKVYCPTCAKEREGILLEKAVMVASLEDEDVVPTPLWCDGCGEPIPVTISEEAATVLHKTIDGLEAVIFDKNLRDVRPSLWRRALEWKEKIEDYLLKADVHKKSKRFAS